MLESARLHQVLLGNRTDSHTHLTLDSQDRSLQPDKILDPSGVSRYNSLPRHFHINIDHNCHKQGEKRVLSKHWIRPNVIPGSQTLSIPKFNGYSSTLMEIATKLIPKNSFTIPLPRKTIYWSQWGENKHQSHTSNFLANLPPDHVLN